jgi:multiple sugar transport system permease protein
LSSHREPSALGRFLERHADQILIWPAVLLLLAFSIFPTIASATLALSRLDLAPGGFTLTFVGLRNFQRLLFGSQQDHLLGTMAPLGPLATGLWLAAAGLVLVGIARYVVRNLGREPLALVVGLFGRVLAALLFLALLALVLSTNAPGGFPGSLVTTLVYVLGGVSIQFLLGLGLALLVARPIKGRRFFRVVFFLPLMVTPVGIAYGFRMLADTGKGPLAPIWQAFGLEEFAWAADPWAARIVVMIGDTWQWTPFMFLVLLAALETQPKDQVEAAWLDGAGPWQVFRFVTWPAIAPVAATVVLIRLIEAFKIVDLPNVLTNGGPGFATESLTLHAFIAWRTQDLGGSAAVGYILLFVAVVICTSFVNFLAKRARGP